ncbi:MAG TPA: alpha/beta hydrolase [Streptosporangiaceae bacterium]|nr:alpha/beta hydrolase [Streptosporangiaceae bacterium]
MTARRGGALALVVALLCAALSACGSAPKATPAVESVVSAPVRIAHTSLGAVGYRSVGSGPPLVLIMGYGLTMESWDPRLVHALAEHHRVVMFDNSGIGHTRPLPAPVSIGAMAGQASALITTLGLGRPDVLGWSMGGMIAQALAVLHPGQVHRLVLCATFPGNGENNAPQKTGGLRGDFPADQGGAYNAYEAAIAHYPAASAPPAVTKSQQVYAMSDWWVGNDAAGRETPRIAVPTLIADGAGDSIDPVPNDRVLASIISGSKLKLYPDAGHAFLFQDWSSFAPLVNSFL